MKNRKPNLKETEKVYKNKPKGKGFLVPNPDKYKDKVAKYHPGDFYDKNSHSTV